MPIKPDTIIKLLNLTTSSYEGEALNAIRAANKHLCDNKTTWQNVISRPADPFNPFLNSELTRIQRDNLELRQANTDLKLKLDTSCLENKRLHQIIIDARKIEKSEK